MAATGIEGIEAIQWPGLSVGQFASLRARTVLASARDCLRRSGRSRRRCLMDTVWLRRRAVRLGIGIAALMTGGPVCVCMVPSVRSSCGHGCGLGEGQGRTHKYCSTVTRSPRDVGTASTSGVIPNRLFRSISPISCHPGRGMMCAGSAARSGRWSAKSRPFLSTHLHTLLSSSRSALARSTAQPWR
jgi:hypothetical protein